MKNIKEGELYKIINIDGIEFIIKYGYYDEKERYSKYNEPIPIYPDFIKKPQYNKDGNPFVTHMQDRCKHYKGDDNLDSCYNCSYFIIKEDLIGVCKCKKTQKNKGENL